MAKPIICVKKLNRKYNLIEGKQLISKQQIFNNLDFTVNKGEFVSVVGPSGCGKSTLLNIIGTLDSIDDKNYVKVMNAVNDKGDVKETSMPEIEGSGSIWVNEQDISLLKGNKKSEFINHNIGFIFQFHHLIPELTALQNVALPMQIQGMSKKKSILAAMKLLDDLELSNHANRKPEILSGGEKQRVAIARALINNPCILLADEPTGSLHPQFKKGIIDLFIRLNKEKGITIVMVTHDINSLYDDQDRLIISRLFSLSNAPINRMSCEHIENNDIN